MGVDGRGGGDDCDRGGQIFFNLSFGRMLRSHSTMNSFGRDIRRTPQSLGGHGFFKVIQSHEHADLPCRMPVLAFFPAQGGIAQLVERLVRNEKARGSNPLTSSFWQTKGCGYRASRYGPTGDSSRGGKRPKTEINGNSICKQAECRKAKPLDSSLSSRCHLKNLNEP